MDGSTEHRGADGLNDAQRAAVEHAPDAGPLIVLAGPGTGKTRVIVHRIAHLVGAHGVPPESIVAVTFTVKAARQLRDRLAAVIGERAAERVNAHTFNGFGQRLLRRHGDLLELPPMRGEDRGGGGASPSLRRSELIDSAQTRRMLRQLILDHDLFGHARAGGLETIMDQALLAFGVFDCRALAPEDVASAAARWREALDAGRDVQGQALDDSARSLQTDQWERFHAIARLHALFDQARRRAGLLTFGDQIMLPIRLMRDPQRGRRVRERCRAEYRHFLVDEFQDVNASQIELLRLLAPPPGGEAEGAAGGPDLCIVGDDDQSIYRFRGADDRAFSRFSLIWRGARVVELSENYRSRPRIIDLCNSVIRRAEHRFAPEKRIDFPSSAARTPPGTVQAVHLADEKEDGEAIAALIRIDLASPNSALRVADPGSVPYAVVARGHADLDRIEEALWLEGLPSVRVRRRSMADEEGVKDVLAWVRLVADPREAWHARRLLVRPPLAIEHALVNEWIKRHLAAASAWREFGSPRRAGAFRGRPASPPGDPGPFPAWLARAAAEDPRATRFCAWFEQFALAAAQESAAAVLTRIVRETGVVHADLVDDASRARRVESVVALLNFAQERQSRLPSPGGVREFVEYYDDLSDGEQGLAESQAGSEDPELDDDDVPREAVRLITAHSAKGLEFDTVFVPRVKPPHGFPNTHGRDQPAVDVPAGVLGSDEVGTDQDPRLAEERRLFYVACTRAERRLVLLAKKNKARSSATHFLEEILDDDLSNSAGARLVEEIAVSDVLEQAAAVAGRAPSGAGPDALRGIRAPDGGGTLSVRDRRRELLEQARREARLSAAGALGLADAADASPERIAEVSAILTRAARRMAAIAAVESRGRAPEWVEELDEPTRRAIEQLAAAVGEPEAARESSGSWITRVPRPPLDLSYTGINDYLTCPRCYYVKHVLRLTGEEGRPMVLGGAMHIALERFYEAFKEQDAAGRPVPGLDDLLQIARDEYLGLLRADEPLDRAELDQLLAQARLGFERLHDPGIHVIETERRIAFDYISVPVVAEAGGRRRKKPEEDAPIADRASMPGATTHRMIAKIDRIDQVTMPDGRLGFRIVDYKTGHATEKFTEPKADDLQMGIYALALRHEYGDEAGAIGQAEYWLFSTGQRGRISLADINHAAVRRQIDLAVTGILAGRFEQAKACRGDCEVLGLSA